MFRCIILPPFQIKSHFSIFRFIGFLTYLDIPYVYV